MGLGIWLISGLFRKAGWLVGVLSFGFFICVTAYKAATGELSCGCFGRIHVNPWITLFTIDVPLFLLLLIFFPRSEKLLPPPWPHPFHCLAVAIPASFLIGVLIPVLFFNKPPDRSDKYAYINPDKWQNNSDINPDRPPIAVNPGTEPNRPVQQTTVEPNEVDLPDWQLMLSHVDIAEQLLTGVKVVLFYHYDCPDCAVAIPLYSEYSKELAGDQQIQFAFIKGPPYGLEELDPIPAETTALVGKLDQSRDWIFESPLIFLLKDGRLIKWWLVEYPDIDQLLQAVLTIE
jgi:thiol-disulfide isomerase/thioredoxin